MCVYFSACSWVISPVFSGFVSWLVFLICEYFILKKASDIITRVFRINLVNFFKYSVVGRGHGDQILWLILKFNRINVVFIIINTFSLNCFNHGRSPE